MFVGPLALLFLLLPAGRALAQEASLIKVLDPESESHAVMTTLQEDAYIWIPCDNDELGPESPCGLWRSDGTEAGTVLVKPLTVFYRGDSRFFITPVRDHVFFGPEGQPSWISDGTEGGTLPFGEFLGHPGLGASIPVALGEDLFFTAYDSFFQARHLWKTDGTTEGTERLSEIEVGSSESLRKIGETLFFDAIGPNGFRIGMGKSDGTTEGTVVVEGVVPWYPTALGDTLFFGRSTDAERGELWKSDRAFESAVLVKDLYPEAEDSDIGCLETVGETLFFTARPCGSCPESLWKSDGTPEGTELVKEIHSGCSFVDLGGTFVFSGYDRLNSMHGTELWRTDGTPDGTRLLKDIFPGPESSYPRLLLSIHGWLFFTADDGMHGEELWKTDGTPEGTVLVGDLRPGPRGSHPGGLTRFNDGVLFLADDGVNGVALWALAFDRPRFLRGDCDQDGDACSGVNDALTLLSWLFRGDTRPSCLAACDADGNGEAELTDAVFGLDYCFTGTAPPPAPFPECGLGAEEDAVLSCGTAPENCQ